MYIHTYVYTVACAYIKIHKYIRILPYCSKFSRDVSFANHLEVDCLRFYFRECVCRLLV